MCKKLRTFFCAVPTPLCGLALGIASLGLGLETTLSLHSVAQVFGALLSLVLVLLVLTKFALHPALLKADMEHPVVSSILPTAAMALMLQSKSLSLVSATGAEILWCCAIGLHLLLLLCFVAYRIKNFKLEHMVPSWFVPFVGISIAAVTIPSDKYYYFAYMLMCLGMCNYAIMLPIMFYRLILSNEIADPIKPTLAIMAAPASLALVAYLELEPNPSLLLCAILLGIAVLMTSIVYLAFFKLLRLPFSPAFAAYTFPMAVGATALFKVAERLYAHPHLVAYGNQLYVVGMLEMSVATGVVMYVCYGFLLYYVRAWVAVRNARRAARLDDAMLPATTHTAPTVHGAPPVQVVAVAHPLSIRHSCCPTTR